MEEIKSQLAQLTEKVNKQSKLIASTGSQVLEIQLASQKEKLKDPSTTEDDSSFVTDADIANLVGELQAQLDFVEERSIRRGINLTRNKDQDKLAPLPDSDGAEPSSWPQTVEQFKKLDDSKVLELCDFYQLLEANEQQQDHMKQFLEDKVASLDLDAHKDLSPSSYSRKQLDNLFDVLARFCGVNSRRGDGW